MDAGIWQQDQQQSLEPDPLPETPAAQQDGQQV